ncbi:molybdate ABC transporter permease subunit [Paratractidigestivibacter sp.]|uniref:molybdate ABC transporter permease subunit n=1 Tax=Paratractidigestivibacter sp. TaxID=2847316 RepID=UPI002ABE7387|nr:molybdate ABC transporter permease subunit [Paratractidigestivibacter sp.]
MDWYPLYNSVRIAAVSTVAVYFLGIFLANVVAKAPRLVKGVLDVILTLPLVLPPTVVGYLLLVVFGPKRVLGAWLLETFSIKMTMVWYAAILATIVVSFPLMYRTTRGAFESFDENLADAARTLGRSETWIFWHVKMPYCQQGIVAGAVLAFARALGEYGATAMLCGYTPGSTATVSTTVYQLWRTGDDAGALAWVMVNLAISAVVLLAMNWFEGRSKEKRATAGAGRNAAAAGGAR